MVDVTTVVRSTRRSRILRPVGASTGTFPLDLQFTAVGTPVQTQPAPSPAPTTGSGAGSGTTTPSSQRDCAGSPSRCGYPDASNTGIPAGVTLKKSGSVTASTPGQVIQGLDVTGEINVTASNVVIRNTRVTGGGDWVVIMRPGADNLTIEDSELQTPTGTPQDIACLLNIGDGRPTILRTDIHGCSAGVSSGGGLVKDSYIHDMSQKPGLSHDVGVASNGGGGMSVVHNTIFNQLDQTATVAFYQDFGAQADDLVGETVAVNLLERLAMKDSMPTSSCRTTCWPVACTSSTSGRSRRGPRRTSVSSGTG